MSAEPQSAEPVARFDWIKLPGSLTALPAVRSDGGWVRYGDHEAALLAERQAREAAEREATQWQQASGQSLVRAERLEDDLEANERKLAKAEARIAELEAALSEARQYVEAYDTRKYNEDVDRTLRKIDGALSSINKEPSHG